MPANTFADTCNFTMSNLPSNLTALLIDDEAYLRKFVSLMLKKALIAQVVEARDGREGVKLFQEHHPDFVLLDINMPHMNGLQTLQALRQISATVPIIMLTSVSEEAVVEECVAHGATFFIRKDLPPSQLDAALREALGEFLGPKEPIP